MKTFSIVNDDISDGYHTFGELYDHRTALFLRLCLTRREKCAWKRHIDTPGWIILYCELPEGQISYHVPEAYINKLNFYGIREVPEYEWDGHTSRDVLFRLDGPGELVK